MRGLFPASPCRSGTLTATKVTSAALRPLFCSAALAPLQAWQWAIRLRVVASVSQPLSFCSADVGKAVRPCHRQPRSSSTAMPPTGAMAQGARTDQGAEALPPADLTSPMQRARPQQGSYTDLPPERERRTYPAAPMLGSTIKTKAAAQAAQAPMVRAH